MSAYSAHTAVKGPLAEGMPVAHPGPSKQHLLRLIGGRVAPATLFALVVAAKGLSAPALLGQATAVNGIHAWKLAAEITGYGLSCIFMALIAVLYIIRRDSLRKEKGLGARSVALGATVVTSAVVLAPTKAPSMIAALAANLLIVIGMLVALWGLAGLRRCFGIMPEARGLVTCGPYRHVRHPMYLGESISLLGITLLALSPFTVGIYIVYLVLQWRRALYEEAVMSRTFAEYQEYSVRTKRFVPLLW